MIKSPGSASPRSGRMMWAIPCRPSSKKLRIPCSLTHWRTPFRRSAAWMSLAGTMWSKTIAIFSGSKTFVAPISLRTPMAPAVDRSFPMTMSGRAMMNSPGSTVALPACEARIFSVIVKPMAPRLSRWGRACVIALLPSPSPCPTRCPSPLLLSPVGRGRVRGERIKVSGPSPHAQEVGQPKAEGGDVGDQEQHDDQGQDEGQGPAGDLLHAGAGDIGGHVEIHRHRRRDGPDGQVHRHHHPEPDRVPPELLHHGKEDREEDVVDR